MQPGLAEFIEKHSVSGVRAYVLTAIGIVAATALRVALNPLLGDSAPYQIQVLVVLASCSLAGLGPGVFAVALAVGLGWSAIPPYDESFTANVMNQAVTLFAGVMICVVTTTMRSALIAAAAARREADFLSREMHHRVKNLFAVVASMMTLTAREQPKAHDALMELRERVQALANAHDVAINATDFVSLHDLVDRLMAPHVMNGSGHPRVRISGAPVSLPAANMTPLALIINELATNAVKYGALARRTGSVNISWVRQDEVLEIGWVESGADLAAEPSMPGSAAFGSLLVEASVAQLRGNIDRNLTDDGLVVCLSIPISQAEQNEFRSVESGARQAACNPPQSSLSALRVSKGFFRRRPRIRDSRS